MTAQTLATLRCPKCAGDLVTYERQGIHVDQCRDCRGVWLDRGELDHLVDREAAAQGRAVASPAGAVDPGARTAGRDAYGSPGGEPRSRDDDRRYDDRRYEDRRDDRRYDDRRDEDRRGGFFGDLFGDILGG